MNENKPFIHLFRTHGGHYLYDVNTNTILRIHKSIYDILSAGQKQKDGAGSEDSQQTNEIINRMKKDGYLSSNRCKEIIHPSDPVVPYLLDNKLSMITLQVTQQCNLRCSYCIYSGSYKNRTHSSGRMSFETAKKGIDFLIVHSAGQSSIFVCFYGGEPLMEFELVKKCMEYAVEQGEGKEVNFNMTTNGTLLNGEIVECLIKYNVNLLISFDGPKEIHDKNRIFAAGGKGSFDRVIRNLDMIRERYPEYYKKIGFSIVLNTENGFGCVNEFFGDFDLAKDGLLIPSLVDTKYKDEDGTSESNPDTEEFSIESRYEVFKILLSKLSRYDERKISKFAKMLLDRTKLEFEQYSKPTKQLYDRMHHSGPCVPGESRLFMDVNGWFLPCERVSEMSEAMRIGHVDTGFDLDKVRKLLNIGKLSENACKNCWAIRYCKMCAAYADNVTELSAELKLSYCNGMRSEVEHTMKDYCMLKEFGYNLENKDVIYTYAVE